MKKLLLFTVIATLAFASCRKGEEPRPPQFYDKFKVDATPRWENGDMVEKNEASSYVFITDKGNLFNSTKYKIGRIMADDGSDYEIIEFSDTPTTVGKTNSYIYKPSETGGHARLPIHSIEIIKIDGDKLWIAFKEKPQDAERRIVQ